MKNMKKWSHISTVTIFHGNYLDQKTASQLWKIQKKMEAQKNMLSYHWRISGFQTGKPLSDYKLDISMQLHSALHPAHGICTSSFRQKPETQCQL